MTQAILKITVTVGLFALAIAVAFAFARKYWNEIYEISIEDFSSSQQADNRQWFLPFAREHALGPVRLAFKPDENTGWALFQLDRDISEFGARGVHLDQQPSLPMRPKWAFRFREFESQPGMCIDRWVFWKLNDNNEYYGRFARECEKQSNYR